MYEGRRERRRSRKCDYAENQSVSGRMRWRKGRRRWKRSLIGICFLLPGFFGTVCFALGSLLPDGRAFLSECAWHGVCGAGKLSDGTWKYSVSDSGRQYPAVHVRVHSVAGRRVTCAICCFAETNIHKKRTEKYVSCTGGGSGSLSRARMEDTVSFQRPAEPCVACDGQGGRWSG